MDLSDGFKDWLLDKIADELIEHEGIYENKYDLVCKLFEGEEGTGTVTYNRYEAREFIEEYFDDAAVIAENYKLSFGDTFTPLEDPEAFQVEMLTSGAIHLFGECKFIEDRPKDQIEINLATTALILSDCGYEVDYTKEELESLRETYDKDPKEALLLAKSYKSQREPSSLNQEKEVVRAASEKLSGTRVEKDSRCQEQEM